PMPGPKVALLLAIAAMAPGACFAQGGAAAPEQGSRAPALAPLGVGALHIAAHPDLDVEKIAVDVTLDAVVASYALRNKGRAALDLAASVALPGLQAYADDGEPWNLPAATPENPLVLSIAADGAPVAAKADVKAYALGVDRRAEIEAAHLSLLPFAPQTARALAGLGPKALAELSDLGIVSPRDPEHPDRPAIADWTLAVVYSWRQPLPVGKTTTVAVKYTPLKAQARYGHADALDLEDLKDEACLTPPLLGAAQEKLKSPGSALTVTEIALVNEPPLRWFDSPAASVSVRKPGPDAIVAFCGMDAGAADQAVVRGAELGGPDPRDFRILIIEPTNK
ncbi:MAG: DUF4424 family protein, partial [Roseiarcus sp.]